MKLTVTPKEQPHTSLRPPLIAQGAWRGRGCHAFTSDRAADRVCFGKQAPHEKQDENATAKAPRPNERNQQLKWVGAAVSGIGAVGLAVTAVLMFPPLALAAIPLALFSIGLALSARKQAALHRQLAGQPVNTWVDQPVKNQDFSKANLKGATITGSTFTNCNFELANLEEAVIRNSHFTNGSFKATNANKSQTYDSTFTGVDFEGARFALDNTAFVNTQFKQCNLQNSALAFCILDDCRVENCNLEGAELSHSHLSGVNFTNSNVMALRLGAANVTRCSFEKLDLGQSSVDDRTEFFEVDFSGTDLSQVHYLEKATFLNCYFDANTKLPPHLKPVTRFKDGQKLLVGVTKK